MDNNENNSSMQHTKKFSVESIPVEEVDVPVIEIEKSDSFYSGNTEEELPKENFYFGYASEEADSTDDENDDGVVEVDVKKLILIISAIVLAIALIVLGIIFIPKGEPAAPTDSHWSAPITDSILDSPQYGVLSVIGSEDNLDQFITGEQFYQLGLRLVEGKPDTWGSSASLRGSMTVARIDAVDAFTAIYENADREKMYSLTSFTSADFPGYTASATNNLTIAESLVFMYRLVSSPDFGFGPNGPLYAIPAATPTPSATPEATPTLPPVVTTPAPVITETATPSPTPTPTPTPTPIPDDDLTQPIIEVSTTEMTNQDVTLTFRFPSWAKDTQYNIDDLPTWTDTQNNATRVVTANAKVTIRCKQEGQEEWITYSVNVNNIDKDMPTFTYDAADEIAKSVEVSVFIQDTLSGIDLVKWAKGDHTASYFSNQGTVLNSSGASQYAFTVNENGTYTIYAKDIAGNATTYLIRINNIDITQPTISTSYRETNRWENSEVTFNVTISDANLSEAYYIDSGVRYDIPLSAGTVFEHPITTSTQGANTLIIITARDAVGNERSLTVYLKIDLVKPTLPQLTAEEMLPDGSVRFKLENAADALSGVAKTEVKLFGGTLLSPDADGYYTVNASGTAIIVTVYDNAGNDISDGYTVVAEAPTPTPTPEATPTPVPSDDPLPTPTPVPSDEQDPTGTPAPENE